MAMTLGELAERLGARLIGGPARETPITGCVAIEDAAAAPGRVTFLANAKYVKYLKNTKAAAVLINESVPAENVPEHVARLVVDDPYFAFRNALIELHGYRQHPPVIGPTHAPDAKPLAPGSAVGRATLSERASIHPDAVIGPETSIHPNVVIERGATIGSKCVLYPGVYIGVDAKIADECVLFPNVAIYDRCVLGNRVTLHANTVIGQDGFGYATYKGAHHKIPQTGIVVIEDDVEMGAGCAVERATMGETRIGKGTKFADLISIGHGSKIGAHCLFVSLVGVSGSVEIGNYVVLGGQVGVAGHLKIGDGVQAMARAAIAQDVAPGQKIGGVPAVPADLAKRNALASLNLYEMTKRLRRLEREIAEVRGQVSGVSDQAPGVGP